MLEFPSMSATQEFPLPDEVVRLFWDVDPGEIDLVRHRDYVMGRIMSRGGWGAMRWLRQIYSPPDMAEFLRRSGARLLAPRDLAYWCLIAGLELPAKPGGGRPPWAGP